MKTGNFLRLTLAVIASVFLLPLNLQAQCDMTFGDSGVIDGGFVDSGNGYLNGYGMDGCATGCGGPYISILGGISEMEEQSIGQSEYNFEDGFAVGAAIGKRLSRNFRGEIEYMYRENDFEGRSFGPLELPVPSSPSGNLLSHTGMLNGYIDLPIGNGFLVPYVGAGAGVTGIDSDWASNFTAFPGSNGVTDFDSSFAYQWMAGVSIRKFHNAEFFAEYRFFEANDPQANITSQQFDTIDRFTVDSEYVVENIFVGVRLNF